MYKLFDIYILNYLIYTINHYKLSDACLKYYIINKIFKTSIKFYMCKQLQ